MGIRGVNLGGWLVYEKWMNSPYLGAIASEDDHDMVLEYPREQIDEVLDYHRDSYITEKDFRFMRENGVDTVRLPIPYYIFGTEHHSPCVEYVDKAMDWAANNGMGVLIDLHTVPMSQNAFDNGGYTGMCRWHMSRKRVEWTLELLKDIAYRYSRHKALWGLQPLNEPANEFEMRNNKRKNGKTHPERVSVSSAMPFEKLQLFYDMFISDMMPILGDDVRLVLHDRFELWKWHGFKEHSEANIWIDTHKYVFFKEYKFKTCDDSEYEKACEQYGGQIARSQRCHPTIVGEWSLANNRGKRTDEWYRMFSKAQIKAWDMGEGGFFWSYRNDNSKYKDWSFVHCIENGWLDFKGEE